MHYISLTGKSHNCPELRVVLIGGRELGDKASYKSVIGNIILGEKAFEINRRTAQSVVRQQEVHEKIPQSWIRYKSKTVSICAPVASFFSSTHSCWFNISSDLQIITRGAPATFPQRSVKSHH